MSKQVLSLDCSIAKGGGQILRSALSFSILTGRAIYLKNICTGYSPAGLTSSKLALIDALKDATKAKTSGLSLGSTEFLFEPQRVFSQKAIEVELTTPDAASLVLDGLLLPALFSGRKIAITIRGLTHSARTPTMSFYNKVFAKYLKPYVKNFTLSVEKTGFYPESGLVKLYLEGKYTLQDEIPPLNIEKSNELVAILGELLVSKEYATEQSQKQINHVLSIALRDEKVPFRLDMSSTNAEESGLALLLAAYYGTKEGYDNDRAFVVGKDFIYSAKTETVDAAVLRFVSEFKKLLTEESLDIRTAELLLPLLVVVGGSIPISSQSKYILAMAALAKQFFDLDLEFQEKEVLCEGYLAKELRETPFVEDL